MLKLLLDGWLALAPMQQAPRHVLDVATGTGIWALEFAEKYPQSFVIGTDLSAIQPDRPDVPNCVFQRDDAEDTWVFPAPHPPGAECKGPCEQRIMFDYVHLRLVSICFDDPRVVMRHAWDNMSPGGWIEFQDASLQFKDDGPNWEGSALQHWCRGCIDGAASIGRDILVPEKYKPWLEEIGFVDVQVRPLIWPDNPWPKDRKLKEVGLLELKNLLAGLRGMSYKLLTHAGYSPEAIETLVKESHDYLRDCRNRPYGIFWVVYGRKPFPDESRAPTA
ncbi:S-adenosyl-L-methionine-dependent methyltransferase [Pestalotiopsis sp. NC0098]|nr:S-adenosyl-L-methionine-dependent methyltransferase [Pestalotiopsis sp. NC0098]